MADNVVNININDTVNGPKGSISLTGAVNVDYTLNSAFGEIVGNGAIDVGYMGIGGHEGL